MYVVAPIQQRAHIIDLLNILLLGYYCVSHISDHLAVPTPAKLTLIKVIILLLLLLL
jgi:hypothetical protein